MTTYWYKLVGLILIKTCRVINVQVKCYDNSIYYLFCTASATFVHIPKLNSVIQIIDEKLSDEILVKMFKDILNASECGWYVQALLVKLGYITKAEIVEK